MTDVDLDRLADYVGGALDGTPEADAVANLVATDTHWSEAFSRLVAADAVVRSDLAHLSTVPEPMPDDVMARLTAALSGADAGLPGGPDRPPTAPDRQRRPAGRVDRRRRRWAVGLSAAAAVLAIGLAALVTFPALTRSQSPSTTGMKSDSLNGGPAPAAAPSGSGVPPRLTSGHDYSPDSARGFAAGSADANAAGGASLRANGPAQPQGGAEAAAVPPELRRLTDPAALNTCLAAIRREYGGVVSVVDYARYQGAPALVVVLSGAFNVPQRRWVVVVGARCGEGGAIADELYNSPAG